MFETLTALSLNVLLLSIVLSLTFHIDQLITTQTSIATISETLRFLDTYFRREIHEAGSMNCLSKQDITPFIHVYSANEANRLFPINANSPVLMLKKCVQSNGQQHYLPILYYLHASILYRKIVHHPREALVNHLQTFNVQGNQLTDIRIRYTFDDHKTSEIIQANVKRT